MTVQTDTRSGLMFGWLVGVSGWGPAINKNFQVLAYQGTHIRIISSLSTPPSNPTEADCYIVGDTPTGAWSGWAQNSLAVWGHTAAGSATLQWINLIPKEGWSAWSSTASAPVFYNASNSWVQISALTPAQIARINALNNQLSFTTWAEVARGLETLVGNDQFDFEKLKNKPTTITNAQATLIASALQSINVGSNMTGDGVNSPLNPAIPYTQAEKDKLANVPDTVRAIVTLINAATADADKISYTVLKDVPPAGTGSTDSGSQIIQKIRQFSELVSTADSSKIRYSDIGGSKPPADAEANVKPDWEAAAGTDAEILRKPDIPTAETTATIIAKIGQATGNDRIDASSIKNLPSGGGGGSDTAAQIISKVEGVTADADKLSYASISGTKDGGKPPVNAINTVLTEAPLTGDGVGDPITTDDDTKAKLAKLTTTQPSFIDVINYQADAAETNESSFNFIRNLDTLRQAASGITEVKHDNSLTGKGIDGDLLVVTRPWTGQEFTQAEKTKLANIDADASGDLTGPEITALINAITNSANFINASQIANLPTGTQSDWDALPMVNGRPNPAYIDNKPDIPTVPTGLSTTLATLRTDITNLDTRVTAGETASSIITKISSQVGSARLSYNVLKDRPADASTGITEDVARGLIADQAGDRVDNLVKAVVDLSMEQGTESSDSITFSNNNSQSLPNAPSLVAGSYYLLQVSEYDPLVLDSDFILNLRSVASVGSTLNSSNPTVRLRTAQEFIMTKDGSPATENVTTSQGTTAEIIKIQIGRSGTSPIVALSSPTSVISPETLKFSLLSKLPFDGLGGVNVTSPSDNQILVRSGANWVNMPISSLISQIIAAIESQRGSARLSADTLKDLVQFPSVTGSTRVGNVPKIRTLVPLTLTWGSDNSGEGGAFHHDNTLAGDNTEESPIKVADSLVAKIDETYDMVRGSFSFQIRAALGDNSEQIGFSNYMQQRRALRFGSVVPSSPNPPTFMVGTNTYRVLKVSTDAGAGEKNLEVFIGGTTNAATNIPSLPDTFEITIGNENYRRRDFDHQVVAKAGDSDAYIQLLRGIGRAGIFTNGQLIDVTIQLEGNTDRLLPTGGSATNHLALNSRRKPIWATYRGVPTGGTSGQVVKNLGSGNYAWGDESGGGSVPFEELLDGTRGITIASGTTRVQQPLTVFTDPLTLVATDHGVIFASLQARIASGSTQQIRLGVTKSNSEQVFLSRLRTGAAYTGESGTAGNGVQVAAFEVYSTAGVAQGSIHCYIARNAANQVGTYATYTPASGASGSVAGQVHIDWEVSLLRMDTTSGGGGGTLGGLTNVTITNPMAMQFLGYDPTTRQWVNRAVSVSAPAPTGLSELYVTRQASDPADVLTIRDARGILAETFIIGMQFNLYHGGTAASQTPLANNPYTIRLPVSGGLGTGSQRVQIDKQVTFTSSASPADILTFDATVYYLEITSRPAADSLMLHAYDSAESFSLATANAAARGVAFNPVRNLISVVDGGATKRHYAYNPTGGGAEDTRYTQTLEGDPYGCSWDPDGRHLYVYDRSQFRVYDFGASTTPTSITIARVTSKEFDISNWMIAIHGMKVTADRVHIMGFRYAGSIAKTVDVFDKSGNRQLGQSDQEVRSDLAGFAASATLSQQWAASTSGGIVYSLATETGTATRYRSSFDIQGQYLSSVISFTIIGDVMFYVSSSTLTANNIKTQAAVTIATTKPSAIRDVDRLFSSGSWIYVVGYNTSASAYEIYRTSSLNISTTTTYTKLTGSVPRSSVRVFTILNDRLYYVQDNYLHFAPLTGSSSAGYTAIGTVTRTSRYLWNDRSDAYGLWNDGTDLYYSHFETYNRETSGIVVRIDGTSFATSTVFSTPPFRYETSFGAYDETRQVMHTKSSSANFTKAFVDSTASQEKVTNPQSSFPLIASQGATYDIGYNESADKIYLVSGNSLSTYDRTVVSSARSWRRNTLFTVNLAGQGGGQMLFTPTNAYVLGITRSRSGDSRRGYTYSGNLGLTRLIVLTRPSLTIANSYVIDTTVQNDFAQGFIARGNLYVRILGSIRQMDTSNGQFVGSNIPIRNNLSQGLVTHTSHDFMFGDNDGNSFWFFGTSAAKLFKFTVPASVGTGINATSEFNIGTTHYGSSADDYRCGIVIGAFVYLVRAHTSRTSIFSTLYFDAFASSTGTRTTAQDFSISQVPIGDTHNVYGNAIGSLYFTVAINNDVLYISSGGTTFIYTFTRS